jgi:hypothetical protein
VDAVGAEELEVLGGRRPPGPPLGVVRPPVRRVGAGPLSFAIGCRA